MTAQYQASEISDALLPRPGNVVGGKYRIDGFVARGGMGAVLAATHEITGRRVALKWMLPQPGQDAEATHRVVREARAAARVRHPNVVNVYDVGEHDGAMFLVMELLEGETLHALLKREGPLDPRTALALLLPAMRGVEAAHQRMVIHRDLKPSNIFLSREHGAREPTPQVLDFGISKIMSTAGDGEHSLTRTGAVLGTPHYMAPERLTDEPTDARADVYSLGVILYQCLAGRLPFQETNYNALVMQIGMATPPTVAELVPGVPAGLSAVVMRAMAREAERRFSSVVALGDALQPFSTGVAVACRPRGTSQWWLLALAACALAAIAILATQQRSTPAQAAPQVIATPQVEPAKAEATLQVVKATPAAATAEPTSHVETARQVEPKRTLKKTPASNGTDERMRGRHRTHERVAPAGSPTELAKTFNANQPVPISLEQF